MKSKSLCICVCKSIFLTLSFAIFKASLANSAFENKIIVRTLILDQMGMLVSDPHMIFGVVNLEESECYAVSPPHGVRLMVGDKYTFVENSDVIEKLRLALKHSYPRCKIVKVLN